MIVVTGAAGRLGRRVVQRLIGKGYDVLGTDRVPHSESPSPFVQVDLCNAEKTTELLTDAEAVIHMGAIPGPRGDTPHEVSEKQHPEHIQCPLGGGGEETPAGGVFLQCLRHGLGA